MTEERSAHPERLSRHGFEVRNALAVSGVEATPDQVAAWASRTGRLELLDRRPDNELPPVSLRAACRWFVAEFGRLPDPIPDNWLDFPPEAP